MDDSPCISARGAVAKFVLADTVCTHWQHDLEDGSPKLFRETNRSHHWDNVALHFDTTTDAELFPKGPKATSWAFAQWSKIQGQSGHEGVSTERAEAVRAGSGAIMGDARASSMRTSPTLPESARSGLRMSDLDEDVQESAAAIAAQWRREIAEAAVSAEQKLLSLEGTYGVGNGGDQPEQDPDGKETAGSISKSEAEAPKERTQSVGEQASTATVQAGNPDSPRHGAPNDSIGLEAKCESADETPSQTESFEALKAGGALTQADAQPEADRDPDTAGDSDWQVTDPLRQAAAPSANQTGLSAAPADLSAEQRERGSEVQKVGNEENLSPDGAESLNRRTDLKAAPAKEILEDMGMQIVPESTREKASGGRDGGPSPSQSSEGLEAGRTKGASSKANLVASKPDKEGPLQGQSQGAPRSSEASGGRASQRASGVERVGVGMRIKHRGPHAVMELLAGGSAARSKAVRVGDVLMAVDGRPVEGLPIDSITAMIVGPEVCLHACTLLLCDRQADLCSAPAQGSEVQLALKRSERTAQGLLETKEFTVRISRQRQQRTQLP